MNRPQAEHIAHIACAFRPEWPPAAVATELTHAVGNDLDIITATFLTARNPAHQTAKRIHTVLEELTGPFGTTTGPTTPQATVDRRPCPAHSWERATNCAACHSEIKAGQRTPADYGKAP
ncbi:hypothetical protein NBM05_08340 [Rothia sp. AR01]|uniref:Uncharacterized protein n=1 Tax=Rothia santali TaxID=2949643 RepID=A0A9X2KIN0_9MICC|nr:hypothetical protein [Rothia santali]MCP3426009.1 hypothetical protein [Rothia santali]